MGLLWLILIIVANAEMVYDPGGFFLLDSVRYYGDVKTTLKVWLFQSQDPDVRLISQIDTVMCFIYNISAMSWRYCEWFHSNIVTISEFPLGCVLILCVLCKIMCFTCYKFLRFLQSSYFTAFFCLMCFTGICEILFFWFLGV